MTANYEGRTAVPNGNLTKTEQRIYDLLADGLPHAREELCRCMDDELSKPQAIFTHLNRMRTKLRARGEDIACEYKYETRSYAYQLRRTLSNPYRE